MNVLASLIYHHAGLDPISWIIIGGAILGAGYVAYDAQQKAKKAMREAADRARGMLYQVRGSNLSRRAPYGRTRLGGLEAQVNVTGVDNEFIHFILIWGEGPIDAIESVYFDSELVSFTGTSATGKWADLVDMHHALGGQTTAIASAATNMPGWSANDKLLGIAHSYVRIKYDQDVFGSGLPSISTVLRGRANVADPRDDSTAYTRNAALLLLHYLRDDPLGPQAAAAEFDLPNWIAAANICDEAVPLKAGGTQPRYTFDGTIDYSDSAEAIIEQFRMCMGGAVVVYTGGQWRCYPGVYRVPTFRLTESMFAGPVRIQNHTGKRQLTNQVKGNFQPESALWHPTTYPTVSNAAYLTADGEPLVSEQDLIYVSTAAACQRLAKIILERGRRPRRIRVACNIEALQAQGGLPLLFNYARLGFVDHPCEVIGHDLELVDGALRIMLELRDTAPAIFAWDGAAEEIIPPVEALPEPLPRRPSGPSGSLENPEGVTVGPDGSNLALTWNALLEANEYRINRATSAVGPWTLIATVGTNSYLDTSVSAGQLYVYAIQGVTLGGVVSGWSLPVGAEISV